MSPSVSKKISKHNVQIDSYKADSVDRTLLGPLTKDKDFLQGILGNQKLRTKKRNMYGEKVHDVWQDEVNIVLGNFQRERE